MHMADALISPAVGGTMWAASAAVLAHSARKLRRVEEDRRVPLMGVLGAFVFAAQMINFSIPGTGSSGHLGGALLLTVLLGPEAAFVVMFSVLAVQALLFADGGLLALGCNVFNLGFFPAFIAFPLIYRPLVRHNFSGARRTVACVAAAVAGLELGALGVVFETSLSGISALPVGSFLLLMLPIHFVIGVVEGVVTAMVLGFVARQRPDLLATDQHRAPSPARAVLVALLLAAVVGGGLLSSLASSAPDGLEWSVARAAGGAVEAGTLSRWFAALQARTALLRDYGRPGGTTAVKAGSTPASPPPLVDPWTSLAGLLGGAIVLVVAVLAGYLLRPSRPAP
jgi:cobalt/nickel transport system permease protein